MSTDVPSVPTTYDNGVHRGITPKQARSMAFKLLQNSYETLHSELIRRVKDLVALRRNSREWSDAPNVDPASVLISTSVTRRNERRRALQQEYSVKLKRTTTTTTTTTESITIRGSSTRDHFKGIAPISSELASNIVPYSATTRNPPTKNPTVTITLPSTSPAHSRPSTKRPAQKTNLSYTPRDTKPPLPPRYVPYYNAWYEDKTKAVIPLQPSHLPQSKRAETQFSRNETLENALLKKHVVPPNATGSDAVFYFQVNDFVKFINTLTPAQIADPVKHPWPSDVEFPLLSARYKNSYIRRKLSSA